MRLPKLNVPGLLVTVGLSTAAVAAAQGNAAQGAAAPASKPAAAASSRMVSQVAVQLSAAAKGQLVRCPAALKLSAQAVCLYVKATPASLRPTVRGQLGALALGDWKTQGKTSSLQVAEKAGAPASAFVVLSALSDTETLVVIENARSTSAAVAAPAGVVKGQPYVLGSDLVGVVGVSSLGSGKYRLTAGSDTLSVTVGSKAAQLGSGGVELPLAPATDGRNLLFPLDGLRSLGCTVTPAGSALTVACGAQSVGLKPIVF